MKYEYVFFDLDGTLTDPGEGITRSVEYALSSFGITVSDRSELNKFIGPPLLRAFEEYCGFTESQARLATEKFREYFAPHGIFENKLYPEIPVLLEHLKECGVHCVVATSKPHIFAERILKHFSIDGFFEGVFGSELDGTRAKKDEVIAYASDKLHINVEKAIMVGDREHDVIGARKNCIDCIGVLYGYGSYEELKNAGAAYIVSSPLQISDIIFG